MDARQGIQVRFGSALAIPAEPMTAAGTPAPRSTTRRNVIWLALALLAGLLVWIATSTRERAAPADEPRAPQQDPSTAVDDAAVEPRAIVDSSRVALEA